MTLRRDPGIPVHVDRFQGTPEAVRVSLTALERSAERHQIDAELRANVQIALAEVLNNVVEHAFDAARPGWIECRVHREGRSLCIETRDDGRPLPPTLLIEGDLPDNEGAREDLPEGGFGWFIVHSLTEDMTYERDEGTNLLSFSLHPEGPEA